MEKFMWGYDGAAFSRGMKKTVTQTKKQAWGSRGKGKEGGQGGKEPGKRAKELKSSVKKRNSQEEKVIEEGQQKNNKCTC